MLNFVDGKESWGRKDSTETLTAVFCGDYSPGTEAARHLVASGQSGEILREVKPILADCDLAVLQFETPLTTRNTPIPKCGPNLSSDPAGANFAVAGGFEVALLANNHTGDQGAATVGETIRILREKGLKTVGAGLNLAEAEEALILEKNGIRIGLINVAENEFGGAGPARAGFNPYNVPRNLKQIATTLKRTDLVMVVIHGGNEHNPFPSPRMVDAYRAFAEAGAAAVISAHTHCPEGIEIWNGVPIVYSLGNFYFPYQPKTPYRRSDFWWKGYMLKLKFDKHHAFELEVIPTTFGPDEDKVRLFDEPSRKKFCRYLAELSAVIPDRPRLQRYFDAVCAELTHGRLKVMRNFLQKWPDEKNPELIRAVLADSDQFKKLLAVRNFFTCETHQEMIANGLRLIEERRLEGAAGSLPEYEQYRNADFGF